MKIKPLPAGVLLSLLLAVVTSLFAQSTYHTGATFPISLNGIPFGFASHSTGDAYFEARIDFRNKVGDNPEVIFETGTSATGLSLLYLPNNTLGLYLSTSGVISSTPERFIEYPLPQYLVDRSSQIVVNWSVHLRGSGQAAISLWVNDEQVAIRSGSITNQKWSDSTGYAGFGQSYNNQYSNNSIGGVHFTRFNVGTGFMALNVGSSGSVASVDPVAGMRFWAGKHIVSELAVPSATFPKVAPWENVRDAQILGTAATTRRYLTMEPNYDVRFTTAAPGATDSAGQWRVIFAQEGGDWFYLANETAFDSNPTPTDPLVAYIHLADNRIVCAPLSTISDKRTATWKWDGPAAVIGAPLIFQRLLSQFVDQNGARRLTTRSSSENPISDNYVRALTGVDDSWDEAKWMKHNYARTLPSISGANPTITGASMPFITLQAEDGMLHGVAAAVLGDSREEGDGSDLNATAREALGRKAVKLGNGASVDITLPAGATNINFMAVRYSIPDDFPNSTGSEHTVSIEASVDGGSTFHSLKVKQVTRFGLAGSTPSFIKGDSASHYKLHLNTRLMWQYWRYAFHRGRLGNVPLDDPLPEGINPGPSPHPCYDLVYRNRADKNKDGQPNLGDAPTDWLAPLAMRRFAEVRAFLDTSVLPGSPTHLKPTDIIRFRKKSDDTVSYVIIDSIDVESVSAAGNMPSNYISITEVGANGSDDNDDDAAFDLAIALVRSGAKVGVWIPPGFFRLGKRLDFPYGDKVPIRGAGMAYSVVFGSKTSSSENDNGFYNFGFNATEGGAVLTLSDLTLLADGLTREDGGKMIGGTFGPGTNIYNVYFQGAATAFHTNQHTTLTYDSRDGAITSATYYQQHTRANGIYLHDCRVRDLSAGGIIVQSGAHNILVENCHVRGSGDDSYAIWSIASLKRTDTATTRIVFKGCTAEAPSRGDGFGVYGGYHNRMENVKVTDANRAGIWIAANFDPLPFGGNEQEMTYLRDFWLSRCGRADSVKNDDNPPSSPGYDIYKPFYRPGTEIFRGALRLTAQTYRDVEYIGSPTVDECGNVSGGNPTYTYRPKHLSNLLVQGGVITGSTNNGVHFNWFPNLPSFTQAFFENIILSNISIDGIPASPTNGKPPFYAVDASETNLAGSALMNHVVITNSASASLGGPGVNFQLVDPASAGNWTP